MDYEDELSKEAKKIIQEYPEHRAAIGQLYALAMCEIEAGEGAAHELELFQSSMDKIRNMGS